MTTSLQKSVLHRNYCDHVRLVAAALVFISHHFALQGHQEPISRVGSWGSLGVLIFFSLSGYLVAQSVERDPNIVRFLSRRLLRIVPGLVVNVLFCILIVGGSQSSLPLLDYLGSSQTWNFLRNIGFWPHYELPGVFVSNPFPGSVNGSLWTLPFEFGAYLLLVCTMIYSGRFATVVLLLEWIAFSILSVYWHPSDPVPLWGNDLRNGNHLFAAFFFGALLTRAKAYGSLSMAVVGLSAMALISNVNALWDQLVITGLIASAIVALAIRPIEPSRVIKNDVSYGLYIYAFPVQQWVVSKLGSHRPLLTFVVAAVFTCALAWCSWRWVERPALRFKPAAVKRATAL